MEIVSFVTNEHWPVPGVRVWIYYGNLFLTSSMEDALNTKFCNRFTLQPLENIVRCIQHATNDCDAWFEMLDQIDEVTTKKRERVESCIRTLFNETNNHIDESMKRKRKI